MVYMQGRYCIDVQGVRCFVQSDEYSEVTSLIKFETNVVRVAGHLWSDDDSAEGVDDRTPGSK